MSHRRSKLAEATTEEVMTCKSKNKSKKGSGQVLPLPATMSYYITQPSNYSHSLFSKDVCLGLQWLCYIPTIPRFLRPILYPKSPMFWCRLKKELPLVLLSRALCKKPSTQWKNTILLSTFLIKQIVFFQLFLTFQSP